MSARPLRLLDAGEETPATKIDLSPLREGRTTPPQLHLGLLRSWRETLETTAEAANAPVEYVGAALLSVASGAIGNARWAKAWDGWAEPPVLYIGSVGEPSSGKSPGTDVVLGAAREIETQEYREFAPEIEAYETKAQIAAAAESAWKEALKAAIKNGEEGPERPDAARLPVRPQRPRLLVSDSTPEALMQICAGNPRGFVVYREELSGFIAALERYNNATARAMFIEAYGGRGFTTDTKSGGTVTIPRLSIVVFGNIQPDKFSSLLADSDDDGLVARFLWVWPDPRPFARPKVKPDGRRIHAALRRLRELPMMMGNDGPEPVYVPLEDEAADMLANWCGEQKRGHEGGPLFRSWLGKGRGHILRLALVLEFLEWAFDGDCLPPDSISIASLGCAIDLYDDFFKPMALRTFGDAALPAVERDAGALARWIADKRPDRVNIRQMWKAKIGGVNTSDRAHEAAKSLVEAGWLVADAAREGDTRGRKRADYVVCSNLWAALANGANSSNRSNSANSPDNSTTGVFAPNGPIGPFGSNGPIGASGYAERKRATEALAAAGVTP